jgi:hypothetical protein
MRVEDIRRSLKHLGPWQTFADLVLRAVNRVVLLHLVKAVLIEQFNPRFTFSDPRYRFGALDEQTLLRFTGDPGYELTAPFLRQAFARGDECYGFLEGDELAAYAWYTRLPTLVGLPGVELHFSDRWVHIYKGLTHPAHRGRRLHGIGMAKTLAIQRERGAQGLVSYVDLTSFAARRSLRRAGYTDFGSTVILRLFGRYLLWASPGCRRCSFRFECQQGATGGVERTSSPVPGGSRR